jgi:hypothetical protein
MRMNSANGLERLRAAGTIVIIGAIRKRYNAVTPRSVSMRTFFM